MDDKLSLKKKKKNLLAVLKGQKWSKQKKHKTDSCADVNGGDTVLLEHTDPVNSAKRDFQYRMHVHTLVD